jgi:hypothetical protein
MVDPIKAATVHVLFHETYTVKNDEAASYQAGQVYEMTPESAALFRSWCDCEVLDPLAVQNQPVATSPATLDATTQAKVAASLAQNQKKKAAKAKKSKTIEDRLNDLEQGRSPAPAAAAAPADSTPAPAGPQSGPVAEAPTTAAPVVSAPVPPTPDATAAAKGKAAAK